LLEGMPVSQGPPSVTINHDHQFLVCDVDATMEPDGDVGFFARDTRFVSGYRITINGRSPLLLDGSTVDHFSARHEFVTPELPLSGTEGTTDAVLRARSIGFRLDRTIFEGVHVAVEGEELLLTEPQSFTLRTPQGGILSERHESF